MQAEQLVNKIARRRHLQPASLSADHRVAYGTLSFQYVPAEERLLVSVLVSRDEQWNKLGETFTRNYRRSTAALSDPNIGGMFDTAGATWTFDEATGVTSLVRRYPLDTSADIISRDIDRLSDLVPAWVVGWLTAVADIASGQAAPPHRPVTLTDNPYAGGM